MTPAGARVQNARVTRRLFDAHFDRLNGVVSLLAEDRAHAADVTVEAFAQASRRVTELPPTEGGWPRWLLLRAAEELPRPAVVMPPAACRRRSAVCTPATLAGVSDDTLRVLVRTISNGLSVGVGPGALARSPGSPKPKPSMRAHRQPGATPGTAEYRPPKGTPSTARLSNSTRW